MQRENVLKLMRQIKANYPHSFGDYGSGEMSDLVDTWSLALQDFEDEAVLEAFKNFLLNDQKGFPPSVGQIVALIPTKGGSWSKILTPGEAWVLVLHSMRNVTYNPRESFDKLPEIIQKIIGGVDGLKDLAAADNKSREFEKQRFFREYEEAVREAKMEARKTGGSLPDMAYRDEDTRGDAAPRPQELRREVYPFEGSVEVVNPRTGMTFYVAYEGYPYGEAGAWQEHGALTKAALLEWQERIAGKKPIKAAGKERVTA